MSEPVTKQHLGFAERLIAAFANSRKGFRYALANEAAFRQELVMVAILVPVSVWLPVGHTERLLLVLSMLLVLVVELLNTAVEATIDRISLERHPLAGLAKDLGSAAVVVSIAMSVLCWVVIAGPIAVQWMRG